MRILTALAIGTASVFAQAAEAADAFQTAPAEVRVGKTPACDDPRVLGQVEDQFEYGAVDMLQTSVTINEFSDLHEKAWFPREDDSSFERRYCQGRVVLSDHERHTVYYTVSYPMGYAAVGWKAEGCVLGLDKWYIYGANCSSLRRY